MEKNEEETVQILNDAVSNVFENVTFSQALDGTLIKRLPDWIEKSYGASIEITKPKSLVFTFFIDKNHAKNLTEIVSGEESCSENEEIIRDFVSEMTNSVAGTFAANLIDGTNEIKLGLPEIVNAPEWRQSFINFRECSIINYRIEESEVICCLSVKNCQEEEKIQKDKKMNTKTVKKSHVLIVDDSCFERKRLQKILSEENFSVSLTKNGMEALEAVAENTPDLILLDVIMPGKNGFEICEILKKEENFSEIPVIFVTSQMKIEDKVRGFEVGGEDYILKPYHKKEVLARVKTHLKLKEAMTTINEQNRKLEDLLDKQTNELIRCERQAAFGQFIQGIVHNIRNPLTTILGHIELLKVFVNNHTSSGECNCEKYLPKKCGQLFSKVEKSIDAAYRSSDQVLEIINSLVKKSRNDNTEKLEVFDLNEIVQQELSFLEAELTFKHKVTKKIKLSGNCLLVNAVPGMISQVFQNIVRNALDAMYKIEKPVLKISTESVRNNIRFSITDNGAGIPDNILPRVFDPFFTTKPRQSNVRQEGPTGTGLGLYMCKDMIEYLGGKITVESKLNKGTTFRVSFPKV